MASLANLRREERIGLGIALALHVALVAALVLAAATSRQPIAAARADDGQPGRARSGSTSTAPEPVAESRAAIAPDRWRPSRRRAAARAASRSPRPTPRPSRRARSGHPGAAPDAAPAARGRSPAPPPDAPPARAAPDAEPDASRARRQPDRRRLPRGRRRQRERTRETRGARQPRSAPSGAGLAAPGDRRGSSSRTGSAPQGPDAEQLVTMLRFDLNPDGSLDGPPEVVRQTGITDANRPQASRHAEQAIRAVQLAAPFDLPEEYYEAWKRVARSRFDRKLSQ